MQQGEPWPLHVLVSWGMSCRASSVVVHDRVLERLPATTHVTMTLRDPQLSDKMLPPPLGYPIERVYKSVERFTDTS